MLTYQDCVDCCELSEDEIMAIAEHEHVPVIVALEIGETMMSRPGGADRIRQFIQDDVDHCRTRGDMNKVRYFERTLRKFERNHRAELH